MSDTKQPSAMYTKEVANLSTQSDLTSDQFDYSLIEYELSGDFAGILSDLNGSLCVSREYEHFIVAIDGTSAGLWQSCYPLPHPSGLAYDKASDQLIVSSTRTPNIIFWFNRTRAAAARSQIIPEEIQVAEGELFLPAKSRFLPGTLYIHDVICSASQGILATITGHNFFAKIDIDDGWTPVWWPKGVDDLGKAAFDRNYFQLNSVAWAGAPEKSFFTAFSNVTDGPKPWKEGYGPDGKGVIFSGKTREPLLAGLTCPHSAKLHDGKLWVCNSGYGSFGFVEDFMSHDPTRSKYVEVARLPGFTRGLVIEGSTAFVGLSRVIPKYEPYAPGLDPATSECAIYAICIDSGKILGRLVWRNGYQIYDVQMLPGATCPRFPLSKDATTGINNDLRYLG